MPNHITNCLEITHPDPEKIKWLQSCFNEENCLDFEKIIPPPADMFRGDLGDKERKMCKEKGITNWYDWCPANWGTKWNSYHGSIVKLTEKIIVCQFDTAWSPPEPIFEKLDDMGFEVKGIWKDEGDNDYHYINEDPGNWVALVTFDWCGQC